MWSANEATVGHAARHAQPHADIKDFQPFCPYRSTANFGASELSFAHFITKQFAKPRMEMLARGRREERGDERGPKWTSVLFSAEIEP